jgi:hypothetical protein
MLYNTKLGMIANNFIMQNVLCYQVGRCKRNRKSLVEIPTHPCIAMKKMLKDMAKRGSSNFVKVLKSQLSLCLWNLFVSMQFEGSRT